MKKKTIKIVLSLLGIFFYILANNYSREFRFALVAKYSILFLAMIYAAYIILELIGKYVLKVEKYKDKNQNIIRWIKLFSLGGIILAISTLQINFIKQTEVPEVASCKYYDTRNNLIYQSMYYGDCPELNVMVNTEDTLEFIVNEYKEIDFYDFHNTETLNYHITIRYQGDLIKTINSKSKLFRTSEYIDENSGSVDFTYYIIDSNHIVDNSYDDLYSRTEKYAYHLFETNDIEDTYDLGFYQFGEEDYVINEFITTYLEEDDKFKISCSNNENNLWCGVGNSFTIENNSDKTTIAVSGSGETVIEHYESVDCRAPVSDNLFEVFSFEYNETLSNYLLKSSEPVISIGENHFKLVEKDEKLFLYEDYAVLEWASVDDTIYEINIEEYGYKVIQYEFNDFLLSNQTLEHYRKTNDEYNYNNMLMKKVISYNYYYHRDDEYRFESLFKLYHINNMSRNVVFSPPNYLKYFMDE